MMGWVVCMRVRSDSAANQAEGEASEDFLIFIEPKTDLAEVALRPSFD